MTKWQFVAGFLAGRLKRPHQRPSVRPTPAAEPTLHPFRPAVLVMPHAAALTCRLPTSLGHVRLVRETLRLRPHAQAHRLPYGIVTVSRSDQRVGNLMQERVPDQDQGVPLDKMAR